MGKPTAAEAAAIVSDYMVAKAKKRWAGVGRKERRSFALKMVAARRRKRRQQNNDKRRT